MARVVPFGLVVVLATNVLAASPLQAQNGESKSGETGKTETGREGAARPDETAEPNRAMTGPAARAECIWLGERAVGLMWRDDLDTAFRHLDLYDRFGCPGEHIQISFRCVVRQGNIEQKDQKTTDAFNARIHSCWINPALPATTATTPADKGGAK